MKSKSYDSELDKEILHSLWIQGFRAGKKSLNLSHYPTFLKIFEKIYHDSEDTVEAGIKKFKGTKSKYGMFGESKPFKKMVKEIDDCLDSNDVTVLITGDTGTGKEMVANAIHKFGDRKKGPLITLNLSLFNKNEEIFYGHAFGSEEGSYTGSNRDRTGAFEAADYGIIYLNEIGGIPEGIQNILLSFFDKRTVMPLGRIYSTDVDVKVVTSTNADLKELVKEGKFRRDLFQRISQYEISVPLLEDRKEDIPLLVEVFRRIYVDKHDKELKISDSDIERLMKYKWEGNIRELKYFIEKSIISKKLRWDSIE